MVCQAAYAQNPVNNEILKPINEFHKKSYNLVAPYDFEADERNRANLPGIFTDLSRSGEDEEFVVKPEEGDKRAFKYGFHKTLQSLVDIGNKDEYNNLLQEMVKSKQVVAFVNAAQTQPAATAGLHYGLVNSQLTLVNQQLSHSGFFEQMSNMPDGAQLLQSMYTGCLNTKLAEKQMSFAEAHRSCIGDKAQEGQDGDEEIADVEDIPDHSGGGGGGGGGSDKILCSDLLFEQQSANSNLEKFKEDFIEWFGDEETTIKKVEGQNSGAEISRKRIQPEDKSLLKRYHDLVKHRLENFVSLMNVVCDDQNNRSGDNTLDNIMALSENNVWKQDNISDRAGMLSIEGFEFNSMIAEAIIKTFADVTGKPGEGQLQCDLFSACVGAGGSGGSNVYDWEEGYFKYQPDNDSPISSICKNMHDYAEGVALGHMAEGIARVRRIILDYTVSDERSDARACGLRIISDQLKTANLEYVQYQAVEHLIEISESIYRERARESGATAGAGLAGAAGAKESGVSE